MGLEQQAPMTYRRAFSRDGLILTPALSLVTTDKLDHERKELHTQTWVQRWA